MRRKSTFLLFLLVIILLLAGCSTLVRVSTLVPSQVDLTGYKTMAVKSVTAYDYGWAYRSAGYPEIIYDQSSIPTPQVLITALNRMDWSIPFDDTADYITSVVENALDQGIYTIIGSTTTDRIIKKTSKSYTVRQALLDMDVDALVTGKVTEQTYKTYVSATVKTDATTNQKTYYYYLHRNGTLKYEYVVQDVESLAVLDTYSFTSSSSFYDTDPILIGYLKPDGAFVFSAQFSYGLSDFALRYRYMADSFGSTIKNRLTPYYKKSNLSLISNKAKDESLEIGYEYAKNGMYAYACTVFEEHWNRYSDFVSGYNTALLYFVTGRPQEAISLANTVFAATAEKQALNLYKKLTTLYENNQVALSQITGEKGTTSTYKEVIL